MACPLNRTPEKTFLRREVAFAQEEVNLRQRENGSEVQGRDVYYKMRK